LGIVKISAARLYIRWY